MATLATNVSFQCLGLDGKPLAGGKVYTYEAGTTTPKSTYTTMAGDVPNSNPVILDQNGKAKIFLGDGAYRMRILDSNDALIDDIDQISRYVTQSEFASFQQIVNEGVSQLTEVREQIDVFVSTSIGNQKGFANGIAPLDANLKIDPIYIPLNNTLTSADADQALTAAQGKVLNDQAFGIGQAWVDVTSNRSKDVTYTNNSGKPIQVFVQFDPAGTSSRFYIDNTFVGAPDLAVYSFNFTIPKGSTYRLTDWGASIPMVWLELR